MSYNYYERLLAAMAADDGTLAFVVNLTSAIGIFQYFYCIYLTHVDNRTPFPLWMHLFYLAHDSVFAYILHHEIPNYGNHSYFFTMSRGLAFWSAMEIYCIYRCIMYEKEGLFADEKSISTGSGKRGASNNKGHSGKKRTKALIQNFLLLLCFYGLILTFNFMIGPQQWPHWSMLTNVVMAVGPGSLWLERGEKRGTRLGLAALIVAGTINTFSPYSQWVTAWPEVFNNPAYYFIGVCSTAAALFNFGIVASLPPKA